MGGGGGGGAIGISPMSSKPSGVSSSTGGVAGKATTLPHLHLTRLPASYGFQAYCLPHAHVTLGCGISLPPVFPQMGGRSNARDKLTSAGREGNLQGRDLTSPHGCSAG